MNSKERNKLLFQGEIDRDDVLPKYSEYSQSRNPFFFELPVEIQELPLEPGLLFIRGPRQYGKSSWLENSIRETIENFGRGTAAYLNGDDFTSTQDLYVALLELDSSFLKGAKVKRIFVDEVTALEDWEKAFKRAYDQGHLRDTLVVTTGSNARDIRRGSERLPGRKGRLKRTDFTFLPVTYKQFYKTCFRELGRGVATDYYSLCGGAPIGLNEIIFDDRIPDFLITMIQDWIFGDVIKSGRQRSSLLNVLNVLYKFGSAPVGFAKLAREAGLANNTVASGYIEQLEDLQVLSSLMWWDPAKKIFLPRKPCKFLFVNAFAHLAFHPAKIRFVDDLETLSPHYKGFLREVVVAQELVRRLHFRGMDKEVTLGFWKNEKHEVDFVTSQEDFYEVKVGKVTPQEFNWFPRIFPKKKLNVICDSSFETDHVRAMTLHEFLLEGDCLGFIREWDDPQRTADDF